MTTNPFATPEAADLPLDAIPVESVTLKRVMRTFGTWLFVCGVSAVPSFSLGLGVTQHPLRIPAMLSGIASWSLLYTLADLQFFRHWREQSRPFHRAMVNGFGLRVLISILLPVGVSADMLPGAMSIGIVSMIFHPGEPTQLASFAAVLLTTLLQGALLNVLVWSVVLILFSLLLLVARRSSSESASGMAAPGQATTTIAASPVEDSK